MGGSDCEGRPVGPRVGHAQDAERESVATVDFGIGFLVCTLVLPLFSHIRCLGQRLRGRGPQGGFAE